MTRAAVRRLLALAPDGDATGLHAALAPLAPLGSIELLHAYLTDRRGGPIASSPSDVSPHSREPGAPGADTPLSLGEPRAALVGPLCAPVPGGVAPLDDRIAAVLVAGSLSITDALPASLLVDRWAPRADDLVALALAQLPLPAQPAALAQLAADIGPEEDRLALSAVQCGRVLAWSPHLMEWPIAEEVVTRLLVLLDPDRPEPLLALVARALAPLAPRPGPLPDLIRMQAVAALDRGPALARAGAYILGFAADPTGAMVDTFLDGLIASANVPRIADLVADALAHGDEAAGLALAARIPLDPLADELRAAADDPEFGELAALACLLLDGAPDVELASIPAPDPDPPTSEVVARLADHDVLAIAGRVLPAEHPAWPQIEALLESDDHELRDAAWCALRDRVRRAS